ncbi:uncharacterized protein DUF3109 [Balneicella halophila]|uniref:Uncharacterized protein DUF3109 n=1 Tax=Balneicella halophila TaxID=1537566 RepID=A0A7L4UPN7_BALHA|nr:DUF3109 family protein [Balneicella halophila]PVX51755.1 uncharacterized protein DUF3109 [Balneicella halophila]
MIEIKNVIVSLDIIEKKFLCDISKCHGVCCEEGDSGAPLESEEEDILKEIYPKVKPFLREEGIKAIEEQGVAVVDFEGDLVTPLRANKECAFTVYEEGVALCGIERAYEAGAVDFKKPISCALYPIRAKKYSQFEGLNYDIQPMCNVARILGTKRGLPIYKFLKLPLIRKYGEDWYEELDKVATEYLKLEKQDPIQMKK